MRLTSTSDRARDRPRSECRVARPKRASGGRSPARPSSTFPAITAPTPDTRTEWWYVTGLVDDAGGRRYGFQITFFRQGLAPGDPEPGSSILRARQIAAAHLAIADIEAGEFHHAERLRRSGGGLAGWSTDDLEVWLDDWEMRRDDTGSIEIVARDAADRYRAGAHPRGRKTPRAPRRRRLLAEGRRRRATRPPI